MEISKQEEQPSGRIQYRSSLQGLIKLLTKITLTAEQIEVLEKYCPFWKIIKLVNDRKINLGMTEKTDIDIKEIIDRFDIKSDSFTFGGASINIARSDIVQTFGIVSGNVPLILGSNKCIGTTWYENFKDIDRPTTSNILKKVVEAADRKGYEASENLCKLVTLYLLTSLFVTGKGGVFSWSYHNSLKDVARIKDFDWATHIHEDLMHSLRSDKPSDVKGCVAAIPYVIMENVLSANKANTTAELWCHKWSMKRLVELKANGVLNSELDTQKTLRSSQNIGSLCEAGYSREETTGDDEWDGDKIQEHDSNTAGIVNLDDDNHVLKSAREISDSNMSSLYVNPTWESGASSQNIGLEKLETEMDSIADELRELSQENNNPTKKDFESIKSALEHEFHEKVLQIEELKTQLGQKEAALTDALMANEELQHYLDQQANSVKALKHENDNLHQIIIDMKDDQCAHIITQEFSNANKHSMGSDDAQDLFGDLPPDVLQQVETITHKVTQEYKRKKIEKIITKKEGKVDLAEKGMVKKGKVVMSTPPSRVLRLKAKTRAQKRRSDSFEWEEFSEPKSKLVKKLDTNKTGKPIAAKVGEKARLLIDTPVSIILPTHSENKEMKAMTKLEPISKEWEGGIYLGPKLFEKMRWIDSLPGRRSVVVVKFPKDPNRIGAYVDLGDICNLLQGKMMTSNCIDAHAELLRKQHNKLDSSDWVIFDSTIWLYVRSIAENNDPWAAERSFHIDDMIHNHVKNKEYERLIFPIVTNGNNPISVSPFHWTLLVLDQGNSRDNCWYYYNSMSDGSMDDPFLEDATLLKTYVEDKLDWEWRNYFTPAGQPKEQTQSSQRHRRFPVVKVQCPQQAPNSFDCGVHVCFMMEELSKRKVIPTKLTQTELLKYKATLAQRFLGKFRAKR